MHAADGIAEGDIEQSVTLESRDELGQTASAFRRMIAYVQEIAHAADRVADGDLTVQVSPRSERDALGNSFARLVSKLGSAIGRVSAQAASVSSASTQMASTSDEMGRAVGEIATAISDMAQGEERTVQMMAARARAPSRQPSQVQASLGDVRETAQMADEAREVVEQGLQAAAERPKRWRLSATPRRSRRGDRRVVLEVPADRVDRADDHRDRRADQPARLERRDRSRPRRRSRPRVRGRRRRGQKARRGIPARGRGDRRR